MSDKKGGGSGGAGKIISLVLIAALIGLGLWIVLRQGGKDAADKPTPGMVVTPPKADPGAATDDEGGLVDARSEVPRLPPAGANTPKGDTLDIELSKYAGYSGLIVANGGLAPAEGSVLQKKYGLKLNIRLSEEEDWGKLATGKLAASATTVDVLAVYGRQLGAVVPALIGFSRGADGLVVRSSIKRINQLKGRVLVTSQFNEADFFARFLAREAGLPLNVLAGKDATPDPEKVNLVFAEDAEQAGKIFLKDVQGGSEQLAGCVTWAPFTDEVVKQSGGKAHALVTNTNLLIVADVLLVNKGLAEQQPKLVGALVDGLLEGNRMVRENPEAHAEVIAKAFGWQRAEVGGQLAKVHLANLPENLAFFSGAIDAAGSFGGIYQSALMAYGNELIKNPVSEDKLADLSHLQALEKSGAYKDQKILIAPIKSGGSKTLEGDPLLAKDIRFFFEPNSAKLDLTGEGKATNEENLAAIKKLLQVSPGSTVLLRGHVDDAMVAEFRKLGGEAQVQKMALSAVQLSKDRAEEVRKHLTQKFKLEPKRVDIFGAGWNEPVSKADQDLNRRVEVHWFTLE
ncbi:OmpA family protein [Chondromyces apiculatus]|uniref:Putative sulfonate/nitrate transport system substrate-binding protein n=1 Tax=Chondromyces apiculatus DSM 436 TaxID=1192034 RepID=A0A017T031_9BACT|nr:OmpA family protein [Chondromyces apiculatus]EYF02584.1 putative sulfonate/nitrate transport system substrate-binding protein [Chondromyces apiculatus DSM 436]